MVFLALGFDALRVMDSLREVQVQYSAYRTHNSVPSIAIATRSHSADHHAPQTDISIKMADAAQRVNVQADFNFVMRHP